MRHYPIAKTLTLFPAFLGAWHLCHAGCDQSLRPGDDVAAAISNAASGSTICLEAGNYGYISLFNIIKSSDVTVRAAPLGGFGYVPPFSRQIPIISLSITGSAHLRFSYLTFTGLNMGNGGNRDISIVNNIFTGQALVKGEVGGAANIKIEGNRFNNISVCSNCAEGGLQISDGEGVVVINNDFNGGGASDGIQLQGSGKNGIIGPGNVFRGFIQGGDTRHFDAIQLSGGASNYTIYGNHFINNTDCIMAPDGNESLIIKDNVFIGNGTNSLQIHLGGQNKSTFNHNTVIGMRIGLNKNSGNQLPSTYGMLRDNIFVNSQLDISCANCSFTSNLYDPNSMPFGEKPFQGAPTFTGGNAPTGWLGYQLTSNSLGYRQASDGGDIGPNYFGHVTVPNLVGLEYIIGSHTIPCTTADICCVVEWGAGEGLMDLLANRITFSVNKTTSENPSHIKEQNPPAGTSVEIGSNIALTVTDNVAAKARCVGF
jgi:hypothetical protein